MIRSSSLIAKRAKSILFITLLGFLSACGSGSDNPKPPVAPETSTEINITGGGIKGPMAMASVNIYLVDVTKADLKGPLVATAKTNTEAEIEGLTLTKPLSPPYLLEVSNADGTIDLTTGQLPVIAHVTTIITQAMLSSKSAIYATPLTTLAIKLATLNADSAQAPYSGDGDGITSADELLAALPIAAKQVNSTLGFGLAPNFDLYNTPPLLDETTISIAQQIASTTYRGAVEALSAIIIQMMELSTAATTEEIIDSLAHDLSDGVIDANAGEYTLSYNVSSLEVFELAPQSLFIPNDPDGRTIADIKEIVIGEITTTGNSDVATSDFEKNSNPLAFEPARMSPDIDNDGVIDSNDVFPLDLTEAFDNDHDGIGNNSDTDDNGDGIDDSYFKRLAGIKDGLLDEAQDFVISADGRFAYIGSKQGLLTVPLDSNGFPTTEYNLISYQDLNYKYGTFSSFLALAPDGQHLYWAHQSSIDGNGLQSIGVFKIDSASGVPTSLQLVPFDSSSDDTVDSSEIFVISPDGKFLYSINPYGGSEKPLLIYAIDANSGMLSYSDSFNLALGTLSYEHNFDISRDGKFLFWGSNNNQITVLSRDQDNGQLTFVGQQEFTNSQHESQGLALLSAPTSDQLYVAAGGSLLVLDVDQQGFLAINYQVDYSEPLSSVMAIDISKDGTGITLVTWGDGVNGQVDYFKLNNDNGFIEHRFMLNEHVNDAMDIHFSNRGNTLNWLGFKSGQIYSTDINDSSHQVITNPFEHQGIKGLTPLFITEKQLVASRGVSIASSDLALIGISQTAQSNKLSVEVLHRLTSAKDTYPRFFGAVNSSTLLKISSLYRLGQAGKTQYSIMSYDSNDGTTINLNTASIEASEDVIGVNSNTILRSVITPDGKSLIAVARNKQTNNQWQVCLYKIDLQSNTLIFVNSSDIDDIYNRWQGLSFSPNGKHFYVNGVTYSYSATEVVTVGKNNVSNKISFNDDGTLAYSVMRDNDLSYHLKAYQVNPLDGELNERSDIMLESNETVISLDDNQILLVSSAQDGIITMAMYKASAMAELTHISSSLIATEKTLSSSVKAYQASDHKDTLWLSLSGGLYDVIKVKRRPDSDSDGDGIFDSVDPQ